MASRLFQNCQLKKCAVYISRIDSIVIKIDSIVCKIDSVKNRLDCDKSTRLSAKLTRSKNRHDRVPRSTRYTYYFYLVRVDPSIELIIQQSSRSFNNQVDPLMPLDYTHWTCAVMQSAKAAVLQTHLLHSLPQSVAISTKRWQTEAKRTRQGQEP